MLSKVVDAGVGRFISEDSVRGRINRPDTINHYLYCWNMPTSLRDLNGRDPIDDEFIPLKEEKPKGVAQVGVSGNAGIGTGAGFLIGGGDDSYLAGASMGIGFGGELEFHINESYTIYKECGED